MTGASLWRATGLLLASAFVVGTLIAAGLTLPVPVLQGGIAVALALAALGYRRRLRWLPALLLVALALGMWRYDATRPPTGPAGLPFYIGRSVTLSGYVAAEPEPLDRGENLRLAVQTVTRGGTTASVSGLVLAHLPTAEALVYGDRLTLAGVLATPPQLPGPNPDGYRAYLAAQGIATVIDYPRVQRLGGGAGNPLVALAVAQRTWLEAGLRRVLAGPPGALLRGILLGTRTRSLGDLTQPFIDTGMIHVIAIDGFKVSLIAGLAYRLICAVAALRLARQLRHEPDPPSLAQLLEWAEVRRIGAVAALPLLSLYVVVAGAGPAALRSGFMWMLAMLAPFTGRRADPLTGLALAAAAITAVTPRVLWDQGFQLSLGGTAAILLLTPALESPLARLPSVVREPLAVTVAAQLGTLPVQLSGFGQLSLVAPLANALLLPLLAPIVIVGGLSAIVGAAVPAVGAAIGLLVAPFVLAMIAGVQVLARLPAAALSSGGWPLWLAAAYYAALGAVTARLSGRVHSTPDLWPRLPWSATAVTLGAVALGAVLVQRPAAQVSVTVLNLGGSQALVVVEPDGRAVLLDGGGRPSVLAAALTAHLPFWQTHLATVLLDDTDAAHVSGLRGLTDHYTIARALDPGAVYPSAAYVQWRAELRAGGVWEGKLRTGLYRLEDNIALAVLQPDALNPDRPHPPVALRLTLGSFSVLRLNSAVLPTEMATLAAGSPHPTVLMVPPWSGSDGVDAAALLRALRPRLVVLPSSDDTRDDPQTDATIGAAARRLGIGLWQGGEGATLALSPGDRGALALHR